MDFNTSALNQFHAQEDVHADACDRASDRFLSDAASDVDAFADALNGAFSPELFHTLDDIRRAALRDPALADGMRQHRAENLPAMQAVHEIYLDTIRGRVQTLQERAIGKAVKKLIDAGAHLAAEMAGGL